MSAPFSVLPDDHDASIALFLERLSRHTSVRGVVHVGAHHGQEVQHYRRAGIPRVVLIEANPSSCAVLRETFSGANDVALVECAIADADGVVEMHVNSSRSGNSESSSILPLKKLGEIVPMLRTVETIAVPSRRLDSLLAQGALDGCNFLNMDIQGAERLALRGAPEFLKNLDAVLIETNLIEMYEGCPMEPEIDKTLGGFGFTCLQRIYHELYDARGRFPAWGESLYVRG